MTVGDRNIINQPSAIGKRLFFLPHTISLGLIKQYVKMMEVNKGCFKYICHDLPGLGEEKSRLIFFINLKNESLKDAIFVIIDLN